MSLPVIEVSTESLRTQLTVDGIKIPGVNSLSIHYQVGDIPAFKVGIHAADSKVSVQQGRLIVDEVELPEAVEVAVLEALLAKHQRVAQ